MTEKSNLTASERILRFWFADVPNSAKALENRSEFWFGEGALADVDRQIEREFRAEIERAAARKLESWEAAPRARLALILLLDQFPRNVFRGTPRAFATDAMALDLALEGMRLHADAELIPLERLFFYMPLQHAENRDAQERAVAACSTLALDAPQFMRSFFDVCTRSAEQHRDIIRRFGRFPHRNAILGRENTPPERDYLQANRHDFGQKP
ncbi:MAG TPA: DUF924 family protein [Steroidobacteraceae bacterium]|nr:DUF924 family protein [Steroidobacteraceae bacterium]